MASASLSSQAATALSLASSLGLSLRADWLEAAARAAATAAGGGNLSSSSPLTAEALVSLVLNADLNSAGAGGSLPGDLDVRRGRKREREREGDARPREEKGEKARNSWSSSSLLSARGNRKKKTHLDLDPRKKKKKKQSLHGRTLSGRRILQADEVVNAAASAKHR
jgi:hypothetical protein